jgi:hypothetical protein
MQIADWEEFGLGANGTVWQKSDAVSERGPLHGERG